MPFMVRSLQLSSASRFFLADSVQGEPVSFREVVEGTSYSPFQVVVCWSGFPSEWLLGLVD